ncbi:MAG: SDR family oxidoreductase [Dehalococcoidia bacterium]
MDYGIAGKKALVTGSSRGIGRAAAFALAREGVDVAICARQLDRLEEVAEAIRAETGVKVVALQGDMAVPDDIKRVVSEAADGLGGLDILVNNAANFNIGTMGELRDEDWVHHFNVKVFGYIRCMREATPHMQRAGWGRVINIAGIAARQSGGIGSTAGATNAAVVNITKSAAESLAREGITANVIHPGPTETDRHQINMERRVRDTGMSMEDAERETVAGIPIGRMVQAEDIANMIVHFASQGASAVTGQAIAVDGGSTRGVYY